MAELKITTIQKAEKTIKVKTWKKAVKKKNDGKKTKQFRRSAEKGHACISKKTPI